MRWRPWMWLSLSMVCFLAAVYFWHLGDQWAAQKEKAANPHGTNQTQPNEAPAKPASHSRVTIPTAPVQLLSEAGHVNSLPVKHPGKTNQVSRTAYRLTNTPASLAKLTHSDTAILLQNALIDTAAKAGAPAIPEALRSQGDPGSYIVQARGSLDNNFRALLKTAGASVVSYVPNN